MLPSGCWSQVGDLKPAPAEMTSGDTRERVCVAPGCRVTLVGLVVAAVGASGEGVPDGERWGLMGQDDSAASE